MVFQLFIIRRKMVIGLLLTLMVSCLVAVFGARLPDQQVCINLFYSSLTQPFTSGNLILDTTNGHMTPDTRNNIPGIYFASPDNSQAIYLKSVPRQPDLVDISIQATALSPSPQPHLLQQGIHMRGSDTGLLGNQVRWSRDNQHIAYLWSNGEQDFFLSVADTMDYQIKTVSPFAKDPSKAFYTQIQEWSADNHYLTVIDQILDRTHYTFWDTNTLTPVPYSMNDRSLTRGVWSPSGHLFAAVVKNDDLKPSDLIILNLDQPNTTIQIPLAEIGIQHLMWSPDGNALVVGYLTCEGDNCRQQWHYALFQKDGTVLASNLTGSTFNKTNVVDDIGYDPDGRTVYSGYDFNAAWSADGKQFIYIGQPDEGKNPTYSIDIFDLDQRQVMTQGTYTETNFGTRFFHTNRNDAVSSRIIEPIPYVPLSDQIILTYFENGKISVALTDAHHEKPTVLLRGADTLTTLANQQWQAQHWVTDRNNKDHIMIEWSTGQGENKRTRLTTADANGDHLRTIDLESDEILAPDFINHEHESLLGFKGKKGDQYNLYMLNLDTGEQTQLLDNIDAGSVWEVFFNPRSNRMLIRGNIGGLNYGQLYLRSESKDDLKKIDIQPRSSSLWSNDGEKILLIAEGDNKTQHLLILDTDAHPLTDYFIGATTSHNYYPAGWSKCY